MIADRPLVVLRFAAGQAAFHSFIGAVFVAICLYLASRFALHRADILMTTYSRSRWFFEFGNTADGWTGIVICLALAALSGWWLMRAVWRLITRKPALTLTRHALNFHASYRAGIVSLEDIASAGIREDSPARLLGTIPPIHTLDIALKPRDRFASGRKIKLRSNTIEGGLPALKEFQETLGSRISGQLETS